MKRIGMVLLAVALLVGCAGGEAGKGEEAERDGPAEDGDFEEPDGEHSVVAVLRCGGEQTGVDRVRLAVGAPAVAGGGGTSVGHGERIAQKREEINSKNKSLKL